MKLNIYLVKSTVVGALGGLLFGFDTAVIAGAIHSLTSQYSLDSRGEIFGQFLGVGITVSIALLGTIVGAMSAGSIGQKYGSRETLRLMALFYIISALGCAFAWSWPALLVFRFIGGLGIGGSSVLAPVYIAELAPAKLRGRLVGVFQINIVVGILLAYLSNFIIGHFSLGTTEWRVQLGVAALPAILFLVLLYGIPRSSRWLVTQGNIDEAREVLKLMGAPDSEAELREIEESLHFELSARNEPLFSRKYRLPIFLAITIGFFNQLSGINAILYYSNSIFEAAGFSKMSGDLQSVMIGAMNLASTFVGMSLIDRLGRKTLLLIGALGMAACLAGVAFVFLTHSHQNILVWLLMGFIAFFASSQGAVIWVYISEVFPTRVRNKGQGLGSSSHWIMNGAIALAFPAIAKHSGGAPFVFFSVMMVVQFFVVLFFYPETKGATLEELQHQLGIA